MAVTLSEPAPVACTLGPGDFRQRLAWITELNRDALRAQRRDGLRLELSYAPAALNRVREMVAREQDCCGFLTFDLQQEADMVRLVIEAPEHARDALTPDDERFLAWAVARWPELEAERLVVLGTPAAAALAELRRGAGATSATGYKRMWHRHPIRQRGASGTARMSREDQRLGARCHLFGPELCGPRKDPSD